MPMDQLKSHLVHLTGPDAGKSCSFEAARITLGRGTNCDVVFDPYRDLAVATHHAEILFDDNTFNIHDLGTRSGTYVNGVRIATLFPLRHEDYIQLGTNGPEMIFRHGLAGPDPQPLPPPVPETGELEMMSGSDAGKIFPVLGHLPTRIGRRSEVEVPLDPKGDMVVSGHHCTVEWQDDSFVLIDNSRNGTYLNGSLISGSCYLRDGDIITLGEGGPRARFRIHPPRRIYPNRSGERARAASAQKNVVVEALKRPAVKQEFIAAPPPAPISPVPLPESLDEVSDLDIVTDNPFEEIAQSVQRSMQEGPPSPPFALPDDRTPAGDEAPPERIAAIKRPPSTLRQRLESIMKMRAWIALAAALFIVVVLSMLILMMGSDEKADKTAEVVVPSTPTPVPSASTYQKDLSAAEPRKVVDGRYSVKVPAGWSTRENASELSMESPDRLINIDYSRSPGLTDASVLALLSQNGAKAAKGEIIVRSGIPVHYFHATRPGHAAIAAFHKPPHDTGALAVIEAPASLLEKIPDQTISTVLTENFKLQISEVTPTPNATPMATASVSPSPAIATPTAQATAEATPPATQPTPAADTLKTVSNNNLGLSLKIAPDWNSTSNEEAGILMVTTPAGLDIRIARDPQVMDAAKVFGAMEKEGWTLEQKSDEPFPVGETKRTCYVGLFKKDDAHLLLVLLNQPNPSTVVVYATAKNPLTEADKTEVTQILRQLAEQAP